MKPGVSKGRLKAGGVEGVLLVVGMGRNNAQSGEDLIYIDATWKFFPNARMTNISMSKALNKPVRQILSRSKVNARMVVGISV